MSQENAAQSADAAQGANAAPGANAARSAEARNAKAHDAEAQSAEARNAEAQNAEITSAEASNTEVQSAEMQTIAAAPAAARALERIRMKYTRGEALRYVSHLDMQLVWERTLRRAGVPLAYSQGFSPHPRLHMASALPLGFLSRCELVDFWLELSGGETEPTLETANLEGLAAQVQAACPPGLTITQTERVPLNLPALQTQVQSTEYLAIPLDPLNEASLRQASERLLSAPNLPRERRGKAYDLRPLIETLEIRLGAEGRAALFMRLAAREGATGRPEEVLAAAGFDPAAFRVERLALILL